MLGFLTTKSAKRSAVALVHDRGTAAAGAAGTITLATDAASAFTIDNDPKLVGLVIVIVSGTGAFQAKNVASYVASTRVATMAANWPTTPDNTSVYRLMHPTAAVQVLADKSQFVGGAGKMNSLDRVVRIIGEKLRESSLS
jgi:hypothetical protein